MTAHEIKRTAKINEANAVALSLRRKTDNYLGLEALSDQKSIGIDYQRALGDGLTATASASLRKTKETGLEPVTSFSLMLGCKSRSISASPESRRRRGAEDAGARYAASGRPEPDACAATQALANFPRFPGPSKQLAESRRYLRLQ